MASAGGVLLATLAACTSSTELLAPLMTDDGGASCTGLGPPIVLGGEAPCAAALAARELRYALCSCGSLDLPRGLFTDSGDPGEPGEAPEPDAGWAAAAVGSDGHIEVAGPVQVSGSLTAGGADGVALERTSAVLGTLRSAGRLLAGQFLSVDGDAFANGEVIGRIEVGGVLHAPADSVVGPVQAGGFSDEAPVIDPPCGCGLQVAPLGSQAVDPSGLAAEHAGANDDARIHLDPDALAGEAPAVLELPCGQFYVSSVRTEGELELRVHGRAALYVGGDVALADGLRVTLDPEAELDLVVAGSFTAAGPVGAHEAAQVRLWLGGAKLRLEPGASLSALVYAPYSLMASDGELDLTGAVKVGGVSASSDVSVRFDPSLLSAGASCGGETVAPVD